MTVTTNDSTMKTSYDEIPYKSNPFPQTHPDRLATLARLFGMTPTPSEQVYLCHRSDSK